MRVGVNNSRYNMNMRVRKVEGTWLVSVVW